MQTHFETLQKDEQIRTQQYALARKSYAIKAVISLPVLGTLLGVSSYRRSRLKQRLLYQAAMLRQQEVAARAGIEAE